MTDTWWLSKQQIFAIWPVRARSSVMPASSCPLHEAEAGTVLFTDVFVAPSPESAPLRGDDKYLGKAKPLKTPGEIVKSVTQRVT